MKKMKKIIATLVCLVMAIATLSACTATTGNGNTKPTEDPKPTTVEPTQEPTTEPTQEPTESVTTEPSTPEGDVIIELFEPVGNIRTEDPTYFMSNFDTFFGSYELSPADIVEDGHTLFQLTFKGHNFDVSTRTGEIYNVDIYFYANEIYNNTQIYLYINGEGRPLNVYFIPLFYNQTKKCFVGYAFDEAGEAGTFTVRDGLCEMYYYPSADGWVFDPVTDLSIYGF
jgi:hypothetical protein